MSGKDSQIRDCFEVFRELNEFYSTGLFLYLLKLSETSGFLLFSGGIERDQWDEMGCRLT